MNDHEPARQNADALYTRIFFLGFLYNFFIALHFTNNALYPLYVQHEGGGVALIGLFMGTYSLAGVVSRPLVGVMIDRLGTRNVLIIGALSLSLPALGYIGLLGAGIGVASWVLRIVQGFGYGAHFSATFTLAGQIAPPSRRNEAIAMYGVSGLIGATIAPFLGEYLIRTHGLIEFFFAVAAAGIVAAFIIGIARVPRDNFRSHGMKALGIVLRIASMRRVLLVAFLFAIAFSTPTSFLAAVAHAKGIVNFSAYFTCWGVAGILVRLLGSRWGDRSGQTTVLIPGLLAYAAGLLTIQFSDSLFGFLIAGVLCGSAHGISFPAVTSLGFSLAPERTKGSAMALVTGMMDAGAAMMALLIGPIAERVGIGILFPFGAISALIALVLVLKMRRADY